MPTREKMNAEADSRPVLPPSPPAADPATVHRALHGLHRFHRDPETGRQAIGDDLFPASLLADRRAGGGGESPAFAGAPEADQATLHLLAQAARRRLEPARATFREEAQVLATRAQELIAADRQNRPESREAGVVGGALGKLGSQFLDSSALVGVLDERPGGTALPADRRQRLEEALTAVEGFLAGAAGRDAGPPALILVHDPRHGVPGGDQLAADGWRLEAAEDPCAAAAERFDRETETVAELRRAVRRIHLESAGRFEAERHEPWLERFDWRAFSRDELLLLTPVVALAGADAVAGAGMASLSRLLRSGRPVQVLVTVEPAANPGSGEGALSEYRFEPAYLGLSHREALVNQTSAARPAHLVKGFDCALAATHAGLHVISQAAGEPRDGAALAARAHPLFRYDPEAGATWAERFDFSENPQPAEDWPLSDLEVATPDGGGETFALALTFADFALLEPSCRHHFRPVPAEVPEAETVALDEYCRRPPAEGDHRLPFLWAIDGSSRLVRIAVSRPLALACRDRLDFWRTLQELAGVRSEYARRAAAEARRETEERAEKELAELASRHAAELERLRREAVEEAVGRITAAILEVDPATFVADTEAPAAPAGPAALAGFAGRSVDEVAAELLRLVDPATLDRQSAAPAPGGDERVAKIASELGRLVAASE